MYFAYRTYLAPLLALLTFSSAPKAAAGPAPRTEFMALPQDTHLYWENPANLAKPPAQANAAAQNLKARALREAKGDPVRASQRLIAGAKDSDTAQALFQTMLEFALGRPAGPGEGAVPVNGKYDEKAFYRTPEGQTGITQVAEIAKALAARVGTPEAGPYDPLLLDHAVKLMAFHGAPASARTLQSADGKGTLPAPDPVVRATLRSLLGSRSTQILAARALGQLGDMETAKEIIEQPGKYPDASIADFGPKAVELYKQRQLDRVKAGQSTGEGDFWQSMRLPPKHQDTAIELAMAGDGGATLAMERNYAVMNLAEKDPDTLFAQHIDWAIRFPGTKAAWIAQQRMMGNFNGPNGGGPKATAAVLRAMDHDLAIIFGGKPWKESQLALQGFPTSSILPGLWHHFKHWPHTQQFRHGDRLLLEEGTKLFKKHYRTKVEVPVNSGEQSHVRGLSVFARHLGMPGIEYPGKKNDIFNLRSDLGHEWNRRLTTQQVMEDVVRNSDPSGRYGGPETWKCVQIGELKNEEDI